MTSNIEREVSIVTENSQEFYDELAKISDKYRISVSNLSDVTDYYYSPNKRLRHSVGPNKKDKFRYCIKEGASKDHRIEKERGLEVDRLHIQSFIEMLEGTAKLVVKKKRQKYKNLQIDYVESPAKFIIIEREFSSEEDLNAAKSRYSQIRYCPDNAWDFFKKRIAIAGGPSSGKTTTAKWLAMESNLRYKCISSDVVEYATSFIQKQQRFPQFEDQILIYLKQMEREEAINRTANIVFSDCPIWIAWIYANIAMKERKATKLTDYALETLYKRAIRSLDLYNKTYVLDPINYEENNVRFHNLEQSREITKDICKFLSSSGRDYELLKYTDRDVILKDIFSLNSVGCAIEFIEGNIQE